MSQDNVYTRITVQRAAELDAGSLLNAGQFPKFVVNLSKSIQGVTSEELGDAIVRTENAAQAAKTSQAEAKKSQDAASSSASAAKTSQTESKKSQSAAASSANAAKTSETNTANALSKYIPIGTGGANPAFKYASGGHGYFEWFEGGTRTAFTGFSSNGTSTFSLANTKSNGDINLQTTGTGAVKFNNNVVVVRGDDGFHGGSSNVRWSSEQEFLNAARDQKISSRIFRNDQTTLINGIVRYSPSFLFKAGDAWANLSIDYGTGRLTTRGGNASGGVTSPARSYLFNDEVWTRNEADNRYLKSNGGDSRGVQSWVVVSNTTLNGDSRWIKVATIGEGTVKSQNARYLITLDVSGSYSGPNEGFAILNAKINNGNTANNVSAVLSRSRKTYNTSVRIKQINKYKAELYVKTINYQGITASIQNNGVFETHSNMELLTDAQLPIGGTGEALTYDGGLSELYNSYNYEDIVSRTASSRQSIKSEFEASQRIDAMAPDGSYMSLFALSGKKAGISFRAVDGTWKGDLLHPQDGNGTIATREWVNKSVPRFKISIPDKTDLKVYFLTANSGFYSAGSDVVNGIPENAKTADYIWQSHSERTDGSMPNDKNNHGVLTANALNGKTYRLTLRSDKWGEWEQVATELGSTMSGELVWNKKDPTTYAQYINNTSVDPASVNYMRRFRSYKNGTLYHEVAESGGLAYYQGSNPTNFMSRLSNTGHLTLKNGLTIGDSIKSGGGIRTTVIGGSWSSWQTRGAGIQVAVDRRDSASSIFKMIDGTSSTPIIVFDGYTTDGGLNGAIGRLRVGNAEVFVNSESFRFNKKLTSQGVDMLKVGDFGWGGLGSVVTHNESSFASFVKSPDRVTEVLMNESATHKYSYQYSPLIFARAGDTYTTISASYKGEGVIAIGGNKSILYEYNLWNDRNTTVDANGFIKKASPIVKLYDSKLELNDGSEGVTFTKIGIGHYVIHGVLGFNSDGAWGVSGGIVIPKDENDQPVMWVKTKILKDGDIEVKTYHRQHTDSPEMFQNFRVKEVVDSTPRYYKDGEAVDIPDTSWIDLRVEMPENSVYNTAQEKLAQDMEENAKRGLEQQHLLI